MKCNICGVKTAVETVTDVCTICDYKLGKGHSVEELKEMTKKN
ncbi:hypothetical protein [Bacillus cereus]|nr:hypothetical protein [Bacillus cereus]